MEIVLIKKDGSKETFGASELSSSSQDIEITKTSEVVIRVLTHEQTESTAFRITFKSHESLSTLVIVVIALSVCFIAALAGCLLMIFRIRRTREQFRTDQEDYEE